MLPGTESARHHRTRSLATALTLVVAAALLGALPSQAASPANLGPPNYAGYCASIGAGKAAFTSETPKQWGCEGPGGAVTPMNMQAACEFSYPQRPISAVELTPGVLYTWQCLQGANLGAGSPAEAQLRARLLGTLAPRGAAARLGLVLKRGYSYRVTVPAAGRVVITWFYLPKGARISKGKAQPVVIAGANASFARAGTKTLRLVLTSRGRRLLQRTSRLRVTARATFTPSLGRAVIVLKSFTLRR